MRVEAGGAVRYGFRGGRGGGGGCRHGRGDGGVLSRGTLGAE